MEYWSDGVMGKIKSGGGFRTHLKGCGLEIRTHF